MLLRDCEGRSKNEMMEARNDGGWWLRGRVARDYILVSTIRRVTIVVCILKVGVTSKVRGV